MPGQRLAIARGRVTQPELRPETLGHLTPGQIGPRLRAIRSPQAGLEKLRGEVDEMQRILAPGGLERGFAVFGRQGHAGHGSQFLHGFGKGQVLDIHQKSDGVTMFSRGKAMIELLLVIDIEARRFLLVERRQPDIFAPLALQWHARADQRRQGRAVLEFSEEIF